MMRATNRVASLVQLKVVRANLLSEEWFKKLAHFARLLERIKHVEGDVVECGVDAGKSFAIIASLVRSNGKTRGVWGFDSWAFPQPRAADGSAETGGPVLSEATVDEVRLRLEQMGFDDLKGIRLVEGDFAATLQNAPERIAFVHLAVLFYEPYRICLESLWLAEA